MTCHIPLARRTAKPRPLSEGRPPAAREGARAGTGQGSGRHTLTRLTPGSPLRPRRAVSPETHRPGPIGRRRPSPPGRFNILPAGRSWGRSAPGRGRENRAPARVRLGPRSGEGKRGVDRARYLGSAAGATGPRAYLGWGRRCGG